jgi:flagellar biosynthetic protein FliP
MIYAKLIMGLFLLFTIIPLPLQAQLNAPIRPQSSNSGGNLSSPEIQSPVIKTNETGLPAGINPDQMLAPGGLSASLKLMLIMTVLSLAPAVVMMTTCFIRIIVVLGFLRQALGSPQLPPNQVLISLSLFLTLMVMWPVWNRAYKEGIEPYTNQSYRTQAEQQKGLEEAFTKTMQPIREFMSDQISRTGNDSAIWLFLEYTKPADNTAAAKTYTEPKTFEDVPTSVLIPAFMLGELKTAFVIGFQIYLPFLIIDMVVSAILISTGMMMLPPAVISLPFKLLLFVLVDGWTLTMEMLLNSIARNVGGG